MLSELFGLEQYPLLIHFIFIVLIKEQLIGHWDLEVLSSILGMRCLVILDNQRNDVLLCIFFALL